MGKHNNNHNKFVPCIERKKGKINVRVWVKRITLPAFVSIRPQPTRGEYFSYSLDDRGEVHLRRTIESIKNLPLLSIAFKEKGNAGHSEIRITAIFKSKKPKIIKTAWRCIEIN